MPATWPPIIDDALFARVEARRSAKRLTVMNDGPRARDFTFRGLLYCMQCHRRLSAQFSHTASLPVRLVRASDGGAVRPCNTRDS